MSFRVRGIAARENGRSEGIGLFAAKRGNGWTGVRQGLKRKWIFGESAYPSEAEVPLPPIVGNGMEVHIKPKKHCSGKPDGAAAQDEMACAIVGADDYSPLQDGVIRSPSRRGAQII